MNYKQVGALIAVLAVLAIVVGVWATRGTESAPSADVHMLAGVKTSEGEYEYTENEPYYTVKATYPARTGLSASADAKARLAIEQALSERIAEFKQNGNFEHLTPEDAAYQGLGEDRKYALDLSYKKFEAPGFVSCLYTVYEDTGGAHPNTYFMTLVFDAQGKTIALPELFPNNPQWLSELAALVKKDVESQYKARAQVEDTAGLLFEEGMAPQEENFSNFVIDNNTLVILIPPYQVAAYAAGPFEVRIPLHSLEHSAS